MRRTAMCTDSSSLRTDHSGRDIRVLLLVCSLVSFACASTTRREIRIAPPERNVERLEHRDSWVREEAALALGDKRVAEAVTALEGLVLTKTDRDYVRAAAAYALGRIAAPSSLEILSGLATERGAPPALQLAVIEAICRYQPSVPTAPQALAPLTSHPDLLVAASAQREVAAGCVH